MYTRKNTPESEMEAACQQTLSKKTPTLEPSSVMQVEMGSRATSKNELMRCIIVSYFTNYLKTLPKPSVPLNNQAFCSSLTTLTSPSASGAHQLPGMLRRWQIPRSGSLPGLVCVVCVLSDLCWTVVAGKSGNYICSNDQNG